MERVGCYTTARVTGGRVERLERHAARLRRDAARLGLPLPERTAIERLALATAARELGRRDGAIRLEWSGEAGAAPALGATTRALGPDGPIWRARTAAAVHPGGGERGGAKAISVAVHEAARAEQVASGVDEVLIYDGGGRLVEGSRANLVVTTREGLARTPDERLGGVTGLGLEIAREACPEIRASLELDRAAVAGARELIAVNAVRGAVAITELDGAPIGDGRPGPLAVRLRGVFVRLPS